MITIWYRDRSIQDIIKKHTDQDVLSTVLKHVELSSDAMKSVRDCIKNYAEKGESDVIFNTCKRVERFERDGDVISRAEIDRLSSSKLSAVARHDLMDLLFKIEGLLGAIKSTSDSIALLCNAEVSKNVSKKVLDGFLLIANLDVEITENMIDAVKEFLKNPSQAKVISNNVSNIESKIDNEYIKVLKIILSEGKTLDPSTFYILIRILEWLEDVADNAEDVADSLRTIIASEFGR